MDNFNVGDDKKVGDIGQGKQVSSIQEKNPGVAAVLSFIYPGLGQIYNEEIKKGIIFIIN